MGIVGIKDEHIRMIKGIVALIRPDAKAYAFGSRVHGTAQTSSDLDIVLKADTPIPMTDILNIKELLKASPLLFSVDIMDWSALGQGFRKAIEDDLKEI